MQTQLSPNLSTLPDRPPMLQLTGLNTYYGESHILRDVDLTILPGQVVCLIGRNGVGKTTLLKSIMGLLPARSGSIEFQGQRINPQTTDARARLGIGYVPQGREVIPRLSVKENLLLGQEALGKRGKVSQVIPGHILELFPVLGEMLGRMGGDLSGGQQQQLAIARALMGRPQLLVLDEPTEGIQPSIILEADCGDDGGVGAAGGAAFAFCAAGGLVLCDAEGWDCGVGADE
jgi:urea transport system ATP-binding protein